MILTHTLKQIIEVKHTHFEQIVREIYKVKDYHFTADQECGNYTIKEFTVPSEDYVDDYTEHKQDMEFYIKKMIEGNKYNYIASYILDDLYEKSLIMKGDYNINVFW